MEEAIRKINSRNQVTIPRKMLEKLKARRGDYVKVKVNDKEKHVEINKVVFFD